MENKETSRRAEQPAGGALLRVQMLGRLIAFKADRPLALPASRKVRALFAYLALAPLPTPRRQLCDLLWDGPDDPRGELRWCLSKIRSFIDGNDRPRVHAREDSVQLDLADCVVDAIEVNRATEQGIDTLTPERQRTLSQLFTGDFLEGLDIERSPVFSAWLTAQRRRFRACHLALLEHLVENAAEDDPFEYLETWLELAPFDRRAHSMLLQALARRNRIREGDDHLATTVRSFDAEGLDSAPIRNAWQQARAQEARPRARADRASSPAPGGSHDAAIARARHRASIAVMPFIDASGGMGPRGGPADALAHDVITGLAKLRSLFVIAQGTVFALHERSIAPEEAGRTLNVDYVVSGSLRQQHRRLIVSVELAETRTARIVWTETLNHDAEDPFRVLDELGNKIVATIANEVEATERGRAILKPPSSLDAWEAHHRGLWHMYRFRQPDNDLAQRFFETAVQLDPTFARAYAGLSFAHFQNAFQGWRDRDAEVDLAHAAAEHSLMADDRDPAAHWAMGRVLWLRGHHDQSVIELERAVDLAPSFALGHYMLAFVHAQAGDPRVAIASADYSRELSPFDPLLFAMLGARAIALVRLGSFEEAAAWAVKAAARPNAHPHVLAIAAFSLALTGALAEARTYAVRIHRTLPRYVFADFLKAYRYDSHGVALFQEGAKRIGMSVTIP